MPLVLCRMAKRGVTSAENRVWVRTHPRLGACTALVPGGARARFVHAAWHRLTYAHPSVLTSGEILEGCSMQSCKAGKKTLMLAYFWRQHPFNPHFPLACPSAQPLSSAEPPGDAVTEFGAIVQAGRGRGESQLCSHGSEQQNSLKWTVLELFCQPTRQSNMQMLSVRLPAACCGATTRA